MQRRPFVMELGRPILEKLSVDEILKIMDFNSQSWNAGFDAGKAMEKGLPIDIIFDHPELIDPVTFEVR